MAEELRASSDHRTPSTDGSARAAARNAESDPAPDPRVLLREAVATISHDVHAKLLAVRGFNRFLLQSGIGGEAAELATAADQNAESAQSALTAGITYLRTALTDVRVGPVDVASIVRSEFDAATSEAGGDARDGVRLEVGPMPLALGDQRLVRVIVGAVIRGAIEARNPSCPTHLHTSGTAGPAECVFELADDGAAVEPQMVARAFGKVCAVPEDPHKSGWRAGLALARLAAGLMGGRVWCTPRESGGAVVGFSLQAIDRGPDSADRAGPPGSS
ncbi:MAG: hypothetical protein R3B68_16155 [Phycisphaerales bacterium]